MFFTIKKTKKLIIETLDSLLDKMEMQEENYKINPESYVKPSWELAIDIIKNAINELEN